ncbi:uncharacterized protein [Muntiacus reevesi]|uniref:uncharacterized protein n=1 Tax=Muntiacus reevesi TaxID=9886 RepID=UPI00330718D6
MGARRRRCISAWPTPGSGGEAGSWWPGWPCRRQSWRGSRKPGYAGVPVTTRPPPAPSSVPAVAREQDRVSLPATHGATHFLTPRPPLGPERRCLQSPTKPHLRQPCAVPCARGSGSDCGARQPATQAKQGWPGARAPPPMRPPGPSPFAALPPPAGPAARSAPTSRSPPLPSPPPLSSRLPRPFPSRPAAAVANGLWPPAPPGTGWPLT